MQIENILDFQICYNADGETLVPIILNSGNISNDTVAKYQGQITFITNPDEAVNKNVMVYCVLELKNYIVANQISTPVYLWITAPLLQCWTLLSWVEARRAGIILEIIPEHIYSSYRVTNRGIFDKLNLSLNKEFKERYQYKVSCEMFTNIMTKFTNELIHVKSMRLNN